MLLIGQKPKLPSECTQYDEDVLKNLDFIEEEVEMLSQVVTEDNFHNLIKIQDARYLIMLRQTLTKGQKREKKNYDIRNAWPVKIDVGDVVLKEKQKDISRKGGKLHNSYNTST